MNVIRPSTSSVAALNMAENAILEELRRTYFGLVFLPRSWFTRLTEEEARKSGRAPIGFPRDQRTLDQYLRKLERLQLIVRIRAQDGGAGYGLRETWDILSAANQTELRRTFFELKGTPDKYSLLLLGPAVLEENLRAKVWSPEPSPNAQGKVLYRCLPLMNLRDHDSGELVRETSLIVEGESKFLHLVIGSGRPRGGRLPVEYLDESGQIISRGFVHAWPKGRNPG